MKKSAVIDFLVQQHENEERTLHLNKIHVQKSHKDKFSEQESNILKLAFIKIPVDLCLFLEIQFHALERLINKPIYHTFSIPKKKGGQREIHAPEFVLKKIQRQLNVSLQSMYNVIKPDEVNGFITNMETSENACNIVSNAKPHVGKKHILNVDLANFFTSIKTHQVYDFFSSDFFDFNEQIASALTLLTTYQGTLPQGAPTSPVLSNFIAYEMDQDLITWSKSKGYTYTRYADDLTFSSDEKIPENALDHISKIIEKQHFSINRKKIRFSNSGSKQTVTGIVVNKKINVDRTFLKVTRAMIYDLKTNGVSKATANHFQFEKEPDLKICATFVRKVKGRLDHIGQVRGKQDKIYQSLKSSFTDYFIT